MADEPFTPGTSLGGGRFQLLRVIASGGQATTYEGMDKTNGERVAIKRFDVRGASSWKEVELAEREARVLSGLSHPGLPKVVNYFEEAGALYLVLEFIDGATLDELRRGHQLSQQDVTDYLHQLAAILDYLHHLSPPLVHRDIKPRNLIRRPNGEVVLVDFGSVRDRLKAEGGSTVVGTFGYMAPEQFQGRAMPGSDVYGAAATAMALLTGQEPDQLPHQGLKLDVDKALGRSVSPSLRRFLSAALEPDPDARPSSLQAALTEYRVGRTTRSADVSPGQAGADFRRRTNDGQHTAQNDPDEAFADYGAPPFGTPGYRRSRHGKTGDDLREAKRRREEHRNDRRLRRQARRERGRVGPPFGVPHPVDVETPFGELLELPELRKALRIPVLGLVAVIFLVVLRVVLWAVLGIVVPRVLQVVQKVTGAPLGDARRQTTLVGTTLRDQLTRVTGRVRQLESGSSTPRYRVATPESRSEFQRLADEFEARAEEFENETSQAERRDRVKK